MRRQIRHLCFALTAIAIAALPCLSGAKTAADNPAAVFIRLRNLRFQIVVAHDCDKLPADGAFSCGQRVIRCRSSIFVFSVRAPLR